ncbi:hypothetical protein KKC17_01620 [Patescibacteria group bacterium]|nr:hypothetical protein [Patescibacteria group bacterium]
MRLDLDQPNQSELKELLEDNLRYAKDIYRDTERIKRYIFWGQVFSFIKILIVVIPLVWGFLYIQPYLKGAFDTYGSLFNLTANSGQTTDEANVNPELYKQYQQLQNSGQLEEFIKLLK